MSAGPNATYPDLLKLGEDVRAEIVDGVVGERAGPSGEHSMALLGIGAALGRRFAPAIELRMSVLFDGEDEE